MRPKRLEMVGFGSFRQPTTIDFEDADLFALVGPTGAGKSTVLDGIVFALYGVVPRYRDEGLVAPIISQGHNEAKVSLTFTLGEREYRATRVVRRTPTGANTREARLECGQSTLAGDVNSMKRETVSLLGLTFEQFSKCILLPQGEFDRFLHDQPSKRRELLRKLLDIEIFAKMGQLARQLEREAGTRIEGLDRDLERLADATPEALVEAESRVEELNKIATKVGSICAHADSIFGDLDSVQTHMKSSEEQIGRLSKVSTPADVAQLGTRRTSAEKACRDARAEFDQAKAALAECETELESLPSASELETLIKDHGQLAFLQGQVATTEAALQRAANNHQKAVDVKSKAEQEVCVARDRLAATERAHAAFSIAQNLSSGDPCPVCGGSFLGWKGETPAAVKDAEGSLKAAESTRNVASEQVRLAEADVTKAKTHLEGLWTQISPIKAEIQGKPSLEEAGKQLVKSKSAEAAKKAAEQRRDAAISRERAAGDELNQAVSAEEDARKGLDQVWQSLADLTPPVMQREGLADDWKSLVEWAESKRVQLGKELSDADRKAKQLESAHSAVIEKLGQVLKGADLTASRGKEAAACAVAIREAEIHAKNIKQSLVEADKVAKARKSLVDRKSLLSSIATLLKSDNFEAWYLARTFRALCIGASGVLMRLSAGQYSLEFDEDEFRVVDHTNADESRPIRTLSGGETFLASLALALALSDQVVHAAGTAVRLESLFLDEGFGSLDPETLETVESAIEELGSQGRTIGLITHVRELAERVPVRFEVRKGPSGSTVERVVL